MRVGNKLLGIGIQLEICARESLHRALVRYYPMKQQSKANSTTDFTTNFEDFLPKIIQEADYITQATFMWKPLKQPAGFDFELMESWLNVTSLEKINTRRAIMFLVGGFGIQMFQRAVRGVTAA